MAFLFDSDLGLETYGTLFIGGDDFGRAVVAALRLEIGGPYNVAGSFCTYRQLVETMARHLGVEARFVVRAGAEPRPGKFRMIQSRTELDTTKLAQATGFQPSQQLEPLITAFCTAAASWPAVPAATAAVESVELTDPVGAAGAWLDQFYDQRGDPWRLHSL